jgi:hypothetical protein
MFVEIIMLPFYFFKRVLQSFGFFLDEPPPPITVLEKKVGFIKLYYDPQKEETWDANELIHLN